MAAESAAVVLPDTDPPYMIYPASRVLARWLTDEAREWQGGRLTASTMAVLELGAGSALPALTAASVLENVHTVVATDTRLPPGGADAWAEAVRNGNSRIRNDTEISYHCLAWGRLPPASVMDAIAGGGGKGSAKNDEAYLLILGADLIFDDDLCSSRMAADSLFATVALVLSKARGSFLLAHHVREEGLSVASLLDAWGLVAELVSEANLGCEEATPESSEPVELWLISLAVD